MPAYLLSFVRIVDAINYRIGRIAMYLLFAMMGILLWSSLHSGWALFLADGFQCADGSALW